MEIKLSKTAQARLDRLKTERPNAAESGRKVAKKKSAAGIRANLFLAKNGDVVYRVTNRGKSDSIVAGIFLFHWEN